MTNVYYLSICLTLLACTARPAPPMSKVSHSGDATAENSEEGGDEEVDAGGNDEESEEPADEETEAASGDKEAESSTKEKEKVPEEPVKVDPMTYFKAVDNFRYEFKCNKDVGTSDQCNSVVDESDQSVMALGDTAKTYTVELHVRGVVEPMIYKDGKLEGERFYTGGVANNNTYNIYALETQEPKQVYYFNYAEKTGHDIFKIDYKVKVKIKGGSKIRLFTDGQNGVMIANYKKIVIPEIDQNNTPWNGQYVQLNVVSVTEN